MGIEGLPNLVSSACRTTHISIYENKTAAIDAMSWLYRGCYACSFELNTKVPTKDYVLFIYKMLGVLSRNNITPIMVFDGKNLQAKRMTDEKRKKLKKENKAKADEHMQKGEIKEAKKYYSRSLHISKEMIYLVIDVLREMKIDCIVAPYEADAQIAYLVKNGGN